MSNSITKLQQLETNVTTQYGNCNSLKTLKELHKQLTSEDPVIDEANRRRKIYRKAEANREREIRALELLPFEDEARRWERGQKVYFGKRCHTDALDWNFRFVPELRRRIEKGDWCYVWQYQPKAKRVWLCKPKAKCEYKNVMADSFSISAIREYEISRTELAIRK